MLHLPRVHRKSYINIRGHVNIVQEQISTFVMQIRRQGEEETTGAGADTPLNGSADDSRGEAFPGAAHRLINPPVYLRQVMVVCT